MNRKHLLHITINFMALRHMHIFHSINFNSIINASFLILHAQIPPRIVSSKVMFKVPQLFRFINSQPSSSVSKNITPLTRPITLFSP